MSDLAQVSQVAVTEGLPLVKFISAFVLVIAAMLGLAWVLKRAGLAGHVMKAGQKRRLQLVESMPVDHRRRLVLLRRDDREHLVLLGPDHAAVIESGIAAPRQAAIVATPAAEEGTPRATA